MTFKDTLHKKLFWDADFEQLDLEMHKKYMVERVLERSTSWEQVKLMIVYYGRDEVVAIIKELPWLTKLTMNFCHFYFDIPLNEMRCYTKRQLMPELWH